MRVWAPERRRGKKTETPDTAPRVFSDPPRFPGGKPDNFMLRNVIYCATLSFGRVPLFYCSERNLRDADGARRSPTEEGARLFYRASGIRFRPRKATFANRSVDPNFCRMHLALCELYLINQSRARGVCRLSSVGPRSNVRWKRRYF